MGEQPAALSPAGHCNLSMERGRNLALLTRTEGFSKASTLVLVLGAARGTCCP